jgi:L-seryl-tRNA(Ser) seleniumtransferase
MVGGGSLPGEGVPTWCAAIVPRRGDASALAKALRAGTPHVVGRVDEGRVLLDPRTVEAGEDRHVTNALRAAIGGQSGPDLD